MKLIKLIWIIFFILRNVVIVSNKLWIVIVVYMYWFVNIIEYYLKYDIVGFYILIKFVRGMKYVFIMFFYIVVIVFLRINYICKKKN